MSLLASIYIIIGLIIFEIVNSVDNAIVNAHVLKSMSPRARRWFLIWGILTAVVVVRLVLPFLIVWLTTPAVGLVEAVKATFLGDRAVAESVAAGKPILLIGGGMFLVLLYLHWLFLEEKDPFLFHEKYITKAWGVWFFALAAILLVGLLVWAKDDYRMMIGAAVGNAAFFILYGFREKAEDTLGRTSGMSDISKLAFLEVLDLTFSIDGVLGAFAFTTNVIFILIGNGIGALVVRQLTISGIEHVAKYRWLKNGAMTSIGLLGAFMVLESFHFEMPHWIPTTTTLGLVGLAFLFSHLRPVQPQPAEPMIA